MKAQALFCLFFAVSSAVAAPNRGQQAPNPKDIAPAQPDNKPELRSHPIQLEPESHPIDLPAGVRVRAPKVTVDVRKMMNAKNRAARKVQQATNPEFANGVAPQALTQEVAGPQAQGGIGGTIKSFLGNFESFLAEFAVHLAQARLNAKEALSPSTKGKALIVQDAQKDLQQARNYYNSVSGKLSPADKEKAREIKAEIAQLQLGKKAWPNVSGIDERIAQLEKELKEIQAKKGVQAVENNGQILSEPEQLTQQSQSAPGNEPAEWWSKTKEGTKTAWSATKEGSKTAWSATKRGTKIAWDATKQGAKTGWSATKEGTKAGWRKVKGRENSGQPQGPFLQRRPAFSRNSQPIDVEEVNTD